MKKINVSFFLFTWLSVSRFLLAQHEPAQGIEEQVAENAAEVLTSPLMMSGRGGGRASEDQKQAAEKKSDATASNRRAQEEGDPSASVPRDDASGGVPGNPATSAAPASQQRERPTRDQLGQQMRDAIRTTAELDVATELARERLAAQQRLDEVEQQLGIFNDGIKQAEYTRDRASVFALWDAAVIAEETADQAYRQAQDAHLFDKSQYYDQAVQRRRAAIPIWERAIADARKVLTTIPETHAQLRPEWEGYLESMIHTKNKSAVIALWDEALKENTRVDITECRIGEAVVTEQPRLCEQALQQLTCSKETWERALSKLEENFRTIPKHREDWKPWWLTSRETIEDAIKTGVAGIAMMNAKKKVVLNDNTMNRAAGSSSSEEQEVLYQQASEEAREVLKEWEKVLDSLRSVEATVPANRSDLKSSWRYRIENTGNVINKVRVKVEIVKAVEIDNLVRRVADQARQSLHDSSLWSHFLCKHQESHATWSQVLESLKKEVAKIPQDRDDLKRLWTSETENIANITNQCTARKLALSAEKKLIEIDKTFFLFQGPKISAARGAWQSVVEFMQNALAALPSHRGDLKAWWIDHLAAARRQLQYLQ